MKDKSIILLLLFCVCLVIVFMYVYVFVNTDNIVKKSARGEPIQGYMLSMEGIPTRNIDNMTFYYKVFGFDQEFKVISDYPLKSPPPTSNLHRMSIYGYFDANGDFHMTTYRVYWFNFMRYTLSFLGLVWFVVIFFKQWKLTARGFEHA